MKANRIISMLSGSLLALMMLLQMGFGQHPYYGNDPHWKLVFEDNFDFLDQSKWKVHDHFDHYENNWVALAENVKVPLNSGYLQIEMKSQTYSCPSQFVGPYGCAAQAVTGLPYRYTTGYVQTWQDVVGFGYVEARIKVPEILGSNSAFWLYSNPPPNEVDIFEILPGRVEWQDHPGYPRGRYPTGTAHGVDFFSSNYHYSAPANVSGGHYFLTEIDDYRNWHVYGLEYTPDKLIWYIDGVKVREELGHKISNPMSIILNIGGAPYVQIPSGTSEKMLVDYVRFWELADDCAQINTPTYDFAFHDYEVKEFIRIGNSSSSNQIPPNSHISLRAKDYIQFDGEFEAPLGSELLLYPNYCK